LIFNAYSESFNAGLRPDPELLVSEWADEFRVLSKTASSEPGRWRTERTPYLKEIMDCLSPYSNYEKVVFMKGAQVGGTECGNNWIGYVIDKAPGPMLVVQPTVEMGKRWSKGRLAPLIEDSPNLRGKVKDPRSRDSGNTVQSKEFPGGVIVVTGANSAVGLRSMPVRYLFLDEIDAYPGDVDGEGDPVSLAIQRTSTFTRRKILLVSTPTIQGLSRIEQEFEVSDKRYFHVPCPFCGHYQKLVWSQIKWNIDPTKTYYECESCGKHIQNHHKTEMLENGKWIAENPDSRVAGFHLSSLYSPVGWFSWAQAVQNFLESKDNEQLLKVWVNTTLGETWVDKGEAPDWERLFERRENYKIGVVPSGGLILTAGVDVQKDRIECEIVAWGSDKQSWSVDYKVIDCNPAKPEGWRTLDEILETTFESEDGQFRKISMLAIDSGYATQEVYNWVRSKPTNQVMAIKGQGGPGANSAKALVPLGYPTKVDINQRGTKIKKGVKLWPVGVSILKSELYNTLKLQRIDEKYPPGYAHFPMYNPEYFKQLTAEQLVTKIHKGYPKSEWQKMRERNEALDCRIYARAAAIAIGIDRWSEQKWDSLKSTKEDATEKSVVMKKIIERKRPRIVKSGWL
jgi:phage terminase large subunit GpA-like protein